MTNCIDTTMVAMTCENDVGLICVYTIPTTALTAFWYFHPYIFLQCFLFYTYYVNCALLLPFPFFISLPLSFPTSISIFHLPILSSISISCFHFRFYFPTHTQLSSSIIAAVKVENFYCARLLLSELGGAVGFLGVS